MGKSQHPMADRLRKLSEELDAVSVSDRAAWRKLPAKVQRVAKAAAVQAPEAKDLLELVVQGLMQLARHPLADMLGAVDALAGALQASEQACAGHAAADDLAAARDRMAAVFGRDAAEAATRTPPVLSLDDAAALLMRLEASDGEGWLRLKEGLHRLAQDEDLSAGCRQHLRAAVDRAGEIAGGRVSDAESVIRTLGVLLDQAITAQERPEPVPEPVAEKSSDLCVSGTPVVDAVVDYMPQNLDPDLMAEFINESTDLIQNAEEALLSLEHDPGDVEAVGKVFRAFHTVKGTSGFLELGLIAEFGHHAETLLSRVRDGEIRYSGGYADLSLQGLDMIKALVEAVKRALGGEPLRKPAGYDELLAVLKNPEAAGISEQQEVRGARIGDILVAQGKVDRGQIEQALAEHPEKKLGAALLTSQAASVADVGQALRTQKQMREGGQAVEASVRVSTQRLDRLIDMPESRAGQKGRSHDQDRPGPAGDQHVHADGGTEGHLQQDGAAGAGCGPQAGQKREFYHRRRRHRDRPQPGGHHQRPAAAHGAQRRGPRDRNAAAAAGGRQSRAGHGEARRLPRARSGADQHRPDFDRAQLSEGGVS